MAESKNIAEVLYSNSGPQPMVELTVPHGTRTPSLIKALETLSKEILPKIGLRGCGSCISGSHLTIREKLENVVRIDLEGGQIIR